MVQIPDTPFRLQLITIEDILKTARQKSSDTLCPSLQLAIAICNKVQKQYNTNQTDRMTDRKK